MRRFIRVHNAPFRGPGAFAPLPTTTPAASSHGVARTTAQLGNLLVFSPAPDLPPISADPRTKPSFAGAPQGFRPVIYVAHADYMAPPVPTSIDNVMPVPVPRFGRLADSLTHLQRIGGIIATRWPRPLIQWPTYGKKSS